MKHSRRAIFGGAERLEPRRMLAGDWQNPVLRLDVDASESVTEGDIQAVIGELSQHGFRSLEGLVRPAGDPYCDVNGDQLLTPMDILHIVNGLHRAQQTSMSLTASVDPNDDPNQNGFVLDTRLVVVGETLPGARVQLVFDGTSVPPAAVVAEGALDGVVADAMGRFAIELSLSPQMHDVRMPDALQLFATDEVGRTAAHGLHVIVGDVVQDWNAAVLNVVRDWSTISNDPYKGRIARSAPPLVARNLAMIHTAMFDAINAVERKYAGYLHDAAPQAGASPIAAAAAAAHQVAASLYPGDAEMAVWNATLAESLQAVPNLPARAAGLQLGASIGAQMIAARAADGAAEPTAYTPQGLPGTWKRTLPEFVPALLPHWPQVEPFAIPSGDAYRPPAIPTLDSASYAASVDQVMHLGRRESSVRTSDQTEIAKFWADGGGTATPPGHWNRIANRAISQQGLSLVDSARTLALLNITLADAGIASWDAKYHYDVWRPIDAIREAASDGNPRTEADAGWLPLLDTPPFPAYTSGHSTFSGAGAAILSSLFGDNFAFETTSDRRTGYGVSAAAAPLVLTRQFASFEAAAEEAGMSRIYGGIHFDFDNTAGLEAGREVADFVFANYLLPRDI